MKMNKFFWIKILKLLLQALSQYKLLIKGQVAVPKDLIMDLEIIKVTEEPSQHLLDQSVRQENQNCPPNTVEHLNLMDV